MTNPSSFRRATTGDVRSWLRRVHDQVLASDPGRTRLRMGASGAVCVGAALAVEYGLAKVLGVPGRGAILFMMLGGMIGMMGSNALGHHNWRTSLKAAALFPVALGIGLVVGILAGRSRPLMFAVFVLVMFVAVYIRRFGLNYFFYGFMIWMGYFYAALLHATFAVLPGMMLAIVVATIVVVLLCTTVFRPHLRRTLIHIFHSMDAAARGLGRRCAALLTESSPATRRRIDYRVVRARARVRDTALMSDGWAEHEPALPQGWTASSLRRLLLDLQLNCDQLVASTYALSRASAPVREAAASLLGQFGQGRDTAEAAGLLRDAAAGQDEAVTQAAGYLVESISGLTTYRETPTPVAAQDEEEFEPIAALSLGQLPGSPAVARDVNARGHRWNPLARLRFTTRQAIQVAFAGALAILAGNLISQQRYYWAVIAAFVGFTGTGTRFDTARKSVNRVLGTLAGLIVGIALASATSGHPFAALGVILVSIFCGYYLTRVSYAYMIFFITIMVSQLYSILGEFSDELLLIRLLETAIGATIGIVVALVVTPLSTRDAAAHAEQGLAEAISEALDAASRRFADPNAVSPSELDTLTLTVDDALRRVELVTGPLTRSYLGERRPRLVRYRTTLLETGVSAARGIVLAARETAEASADASAVCSSLARLTSGGAPSPASEEAPAEEEAETLEVRAVPFARPATRLREVVEELAWFDADTSGRDDAGHPTDH